MNEGAYRLIVKLLDAVQDLDDHRAPSHNILTLGLYQRVEVSENVPRETSKSLERI